MITNNLINLLDEDPESFIALTGCRVSDIFYQCCEHDILIIGKRNDNAIINDPINGLIEIYRINYESFIKFEDFELHKFLPMKVISNGSFSLSPNIIKIANKFEVINNDYKKFKFIEITSNIQKAKEAMNQASFLDCNFWILCAIYEIIEYLLVSNSIKLHPSHILEQLKKVNSKIDVNICYSLMNLELANKSSVKRKFNAINKSYLNSLGLFNQKSEITYLQIKLLKNKIDWMMNNKMHINAYSFLEFEMIKLIKLIYSQYCEYNQISLHQYKILSELINNKEIEYNIPKSTMNLISINNNEQIIKNKINKVSTIVKELNKVSN